VTHNEQDVINLGRIVGIPALCGSEGQEFERNGARELNRAKRILTPAVKQQIRVAHEKQMLLRDQNDVEMPPEAETIKNTQVNIVKDIQAAFNGAIIRRTINSKRPDGTCLNDQLPPYVSHILPVELEDWEMTVLNDSFQDIMQNKKSSTLLEFSNEVSVPWLPQLYSV